MKSIEMDSENFKNRFSYSRPSPCHYILKQVVLPSTTKIQLMVVKSK